MVTCVHRHRSGPNSLARFRSCSCQRLASRVTRSLSNGAARNPHFERPKYGMRPIKCVNLPVRFQTSPPPNPPSAPAARLTPANVADSRVAPKLLEDLPGEACYVLGDLHYNAPDVRQPCEDAGRILVTPRYGAYPHLDEEWRLGVSSTS
jgi:hypothetical protein